MTAEPIISTSTKGDVSGGNNEHGFGYYEAQHKRDTQEDALTWHVIPDELPTPAKIGHCLWTSYQLLDKEFVGKEQLRGMGCTAATTVYDGKGNIITALLADAATFAAVYDKQGEAIAVVRLNSVTHKPDEASEKARIQKLGGRVVYYGTWRVEGNLAISRAIGDHNLKQYVPADAQIDITSIDKIKADIIKDNPTIKMEDIGSIQIINTCDGFTDAAERQTKKAHEEYLLSVLKTQKAPGKMPEHELAKCLVDAARAKSMDNISVTVQTITDKTPAFLKGVYDGHGGNEVAHYVAKNIGPTFLKQCALTPEAYSKQKLSVNRNIALYNRDHPGDPVAAYNHAEELKRIRLILDAFATQIVDDSIIRGSSTDKARAALIKLHLDLSSAYDFYGRNLKLLPAPSNIPATEKEATEAALAFKMTCVQAVKTALSNGLGDDLTWGEYLLNMIKELCNVVIAKVSANDHQFFTLAKSALVENVDTQIKEMVDDPSDTGNKPK